jgi:diadenosine tetraphosphate (Ap4A) HIT family hydrolase
MAIVAEAVFRAFSPRKLNCELLGNSVSHLHWHIFPRYDNDPDPTMPIWRNAAFFTPHKLDPVAIDGLRGRVRAELSALR